MNSKSQAGTTIPRMPLRDEVYRHILDRIHRGELTPGLRVRDTALAAELGVSRTPVREALLRLTRDGVLQADMGRGFRLRPLDRTEIREVGAILGALEALAFELSPDFPEERLAHLAELDRALEQARGDLAACLDLEDEWHRVLLAGCPNRRLLELITSLRQVPRRYLSAYMRAAGRLALSTAPHGKVLHAFRQGDRVAALQVFQRQWRRGIAELEAWVA
ncbi:MAG TPA: GntR family transcriptional regulator [Gemmatimonadales bacterium]|nr:GntR family transcriptional regulator [Gemmatimonadales bacterium]